MSNYSCNEHGKEYVKGCVACDFPREFEELERQLAAARELLKHARCPNVMCVGGVMLRSLGGDVSDMEQCQWCYERDAAIAAQKESKDE